MFLRQITILSLLLGICTLLSAQPMLGYTDPQGDFYVQDSGRLVHLESHPIRNFQAGANSLVYQSNSGELVYYANHTKKELEITNPSFSE